MVSEAYWAISISSFRLGDADSPDESSTEDEDEYIPKKKLVKKQGKNTLQSNLLHQLRLQSNLLHQLRLQSNLLQQLILQSNLLHQLRLQSNYYTNLDYSQTYYTNLD